MGSKIENKKPQIFSGAIYLIFREWGKEIKYQPRNLLTHFLAHII